MICTYIEKAKRKMGITPLRRGSNNFLYHQIRRFHHIRYQPDALFYKICEVQKIDGDLDGGVNGLGFRQKRKKCSKHRVTKWVFARKKLDKRVYVREPQINLLRIYGHRRARAPSKRSSHTNFLLCTCVSNTSQSTNP